jgi:hypothetical protein
LNDNVLVDFFFADVVTVTVMRHVPDEIAKTLAFDTRQIFAVLDVIATLPPFGTVIFS